MYPWARAGRPGAKYTKKHTQCAYCPEGAPGWATLFLLNDCFLPLDLDVLNEPLLTTIYSHLPLPHIEITYCHKLIYLCHYYFYEPFIVATRQLISYFVRCYYFYEATILLLRYKATLCCFVWCHQLLCTFILLLHFHFTFTFYFSTSVTSHLHFTFTTAHLHLSYE